MKSGIFLIGPMGAGKTTVGRRLAKALRWDFIDCDHELESRTGVSVSTIFEIEGEAGFRKREKELLDELTKLPRCVLGTGGGVVIDADNRRLLKQRGTVIYLEADLDILVERTSHDSNRPLLQNADPRARLQEILATRAPLYRQTADLIIHTGDHSLREIIKIVRKKIHL